ncbi:MAG: hypothetical protein KDK23_13470 [Leptospiraceae bacterium]|nr:hypothetical protein [Leptospiraceae bacterium]
MKTLQEFLLIIKAEFKRDLLFMYRYPLEILSFLFFMYLILMAILLGLSELMPGGEGLAGKDSPINRETMILGYCLMQFVLATQMGWSGQIQNESQTGTLEQLSISGHSLAGVLLARGISQQPRQILSFFLLLGAYYWSIPDTGLSPERAPYVTLILSITAFGVYGVAYLFAGLTLIFKRVGFFFQIINFAFLGLFWQDRSSMAEGSWSAMLYDFFPLTRGMTLLRESLLSSHLSAFSEILIFLGICLGFTFAGYWIFRWLERKARMQALLSQY